ncbi:MAG: sigma-54 dependent transcriptional regulator [Dissulfurispiraceae bacterium]|jgi:DNA-binding NtrC family response regulator|nr:sigma-54 dependent transcriptional regulator [Dissulfurispiraceae bacterium]
MNTILIAEDNKGMREMLESTLRAEGFNVKTAGSVKEAVLIIESGGFDAAVTDIKLPDGNGMQILSAIIERMPMLPVVVMTAFGSIELAVKSVKSGAYDFITKPFDTDHLVLILKRALSEKAVIRENILMKSELPDYMKMPEIIGSSPAWSEVIQKVEKVASLKTTVLLLGESGTGKELIARRIHYSGSRASEPFVPVNCAAIPHELIENEMFGHDKGAFSGANEIKPGRFELADKGTIFLDEIGDMDFSLQSKLLRVLQENEFERVGGTKTIKVDCRVIAASNKNIGKDVSEGKFREDLYYRLNVFPIVVPPLRQRIDDIIPLADFFIKKYSNPICSKNISMSAKVRDMFLHHDWKGNVRELKNIIERALILCDSDVIEPRHISFQNGYEIQTKSEHGSSLLEASGHAARLAEIEKIKSALSIAKGNKTKAAKMLEVSYKTLLNKIKEYGIG